MFDDLFTECSKDKVEAKGYSKHAEARVLEMLKSLRSVVKADDKVYRVQLLNSMIKELETPNN